MRAINLNKPHFGLIRVIMPNKGVNPDIIDRLGFLPGLDVNPYSLIKLAHLDWFR